MVRQRQRPPPPLWSPKRSEGDGTTSLTVVRPPSVGWPCISDRKELGATARMHALIIPQAQALGGRPRDLLHGFDVSGKHRAQAFAECCLMSLAVWRRFGSVEFAETFNWVERTDYAAMCSLTSNAVDAAVRVWKAGLHAAADGSGPQRRVRDAEVRAWELGNGSGKIIRSAKARIGAKPSADDAQELHRAEHARLLATSGAEVSRTTAELVRIRASRVTPAGEAAVRVAYERLLDGTNHPIWDLWRKRLLVLSAVLGDGTLDAVQKALMQVKGYCGPDPDAERAGWEFAFDLTTMTSLAANPGPVDWCGDYVTWLRAKIATGLRSPATSYTRTSPRKPQRRPPVYADSAQTSPWLH